MIKISKMSDYAVVVLAELATRKVGHMSATAIAKNIKLPEPTVSKILKQLSKAGLVKSTRGVNGGYAPLFLPRQITVESIIRAIDGPISITECADLSAKDCSLIDSCSVRGRWNGVNTAIRSALEVVTLADMIEPRQAIVNNKEPMLFEGDKEQNYGGH